MLDELKAVDITILDVKALTSVTDSMIICTGTSNRHVKSLATAIIQQAKQEKLPILGTEGETAAEWVLVDLGDVVVHIMQAATREFYNLEKLWQMTEKTAEAKESN